MVTDDINLLNQTGDFVAKYGFLAVGLVLVFLVAPAVYRIWDAERFGLSTVSVGIAFLVTYGVFDVLQRYFPKLLTAQRPLLSGEILDVKNGMVASLHSDDYKSGTPYTKRVNHPEFRELYNLPFMFLTSDAPGCLYISFSNNDINSEMMHAFSISSISKEDLAANVDIKIKFIENPRGPRLKIWRVRDEHKIGEATLLEPLAVEAPGCVEARGAKSSSLWPIGAAKAAETSGANRSMNEWVALLRNDDALIRRDARLELSKLGAQAFPTISQLLDNSNDYRLQLGAVFALSIMPEDVRKTAPADILVKVRALLLHRDKTMRDAALRALNEPGYCYQEEDRNKSSDQRFLVLCHWSKAQCDKTRGPNKKRGVTQTACETVTLSGLDWEYQTGGFAGAWYSYSGSAFPPPIPQMAK